MDSKNIKSTRIIKLWWIFSFLKNQNKKCMFFSALTLASWGGDFSSSGLYEFLSIHIGCRKINSSTEKSPCPPENAAAVEPKSIPCSMVRSFLGSIPFSFKMYSNTICGIPPVGTISM